MIGTIDTPTEGEMRLFGSVVENKAADSLLASLRLSKIGFVFQTFNLLGTLSAFENVELPMAILGYCLIAGLFLLLLLQTHHLRPVVCLSLRPFPLPIEIDLRRSGRQSQSDFLRKLVCKIE
jgi:hypothetical protein